MNINIRVVGPINTGTNLINRILENNKFNINNVYVEDTDKKYYYKHTILFDNLESYLKENNNNYLVIMYKNLYNWLYSVQKSSYELEFKNLKDPIKQENIEYSNIIQLYNNYYNMYYQLYSIFNDKIIIIDYYKIIQNNSFDYLNTKLSKFNLSINSSQKYYNTLNKPSKTHGNPVKNSKEALKKYLENQTRVKYHIYNYTNIHTSINNSLIKLCENTF